MHLGADHAETPYEPREISVCLVRDNPEQCSELAAFQAGFEECRRAGPLMVYICKLFTMRGIDIQGGEAIDRGKDYEIALCRSFSGTITRTSPLFVIPANME